jgi:hypothetical protein
VELNRNIIENLVTILRQERSEQVFCTIYLHKTKIYDKVADIDVDILDIFYHKNRLVSHYCTNPSLSD